jgi:predicted alpha/beta-hydrolase family hydrolase
MRQALLRGLVLGIGAWACALASAQPLSCAVVLLHGKWGTAQSPYLKPVAQKIEPHCQVRMLEMPWSRHRLYDQPYADALAQIQTAVQALRQSGIQWVALGGQSFGANATLAYMAQVGDVDAVLPMAPGHVPEAFVQVPDVRRSVDAAQWLLARTGR